MTEEKNLYNENNIYTPNSVDEWLDFIYAIGYDYDGYNDPENLKDLIDEMVDAAKKARECLRYNKLFEEKDS